MRLRALAYGSLATALAGLGLVAAVPLGAAHAAPAQAAAAAGPPITIGVDNTPPPGKNWTYTHYFPESNINIPQGTTVEFAWNQTNINGLHTCLLYTSPSPRD